MWYEVETLTSESPIHARLNVANTFIPVDIIKNHIWVCRINTHMANHWPHNQLPSFAISLHWYKFQLHAMSGFWYLVWIYLYVTVSVSVWSGILPSTFLQLVNGSKNSILNWVMKLNLFIFFLLFFFLKSLDRVSVLFTSSSNTLV